MQTAPTAPANVRTTTPFAFDVATTKAMLAMAAARPADDRRRQILASRSIHESIRAVVRQRGVPPQDVDDVLDTVVEQALEDENLPLGDEDDARRYLVGCARNKSIDAGRARKRKKEREVEADEQTQSPGGLTADERLDAEWVVREGEARFPRAFLWLLRHVLGGESHLAIAVGVGLSPSFVRSEVSRVRSELKKLGSLITTIFLIFFGVRSWGIQGGKDRDRRDLATSASSAPSAPPAPVAPVAPTVSPALLDRARALRRDAREKFAAGDWHTVVEEIQEAGDLDPKGETDEDRKLLWDAQDKLEARSKP